MKQVSIAMAGPEDLEPLMNLMNEVRAWLETKGVAGQWPPVIPREFIAASVQRGEVYLARVGDDLAATVTLQWADPDVWGDAEGAACYVHRLAVQRRYGHMGLGQHLLGWAAEQARRQGRTLLRLDCWAENPVLVRYYSDAGFTLRGEVRLGTWKGCLFERNLV